MTFRYGVLAILLAANVAAAQTGMEAPQGGLPRELLQPEPFEQTPTLRAPGGTEGLFVQPEAPPETTPVPSIEQPAEATPPAAEPQQRARAVPQPVRRSEPRQRAESLRPAAAPRAASKRTASAARPTQRAAARTRSSQRPLEILPAVARGNAAQAAPQISVNAFAPERATPALPWPFRLGRAESRFDVPGGWW